MLWTTTCPYTMLFNINTFFINFEQFLENFNFYIQ